MNALLTFDSIRKSFGGVAVLKGVSLDVHAGRTLGLVGENGAGKSTLMNILGGNVQADAGRMTLGGRLHAPKRPADAATAGIAFVHQELNLFPNLTVAENMFLTRFPTSRAFSFIRRDQLCRRTATLLADVGLNVPPGTLVERLSAGERQLVEIAKALSFEPQLLILDEPTTSLSERETGHLFAVLHRWRTRGLAMIYISHHLAEVLRLCDDLCVLRDGEVVGRGPPSSFDAERLVSLMVGRSLTQGFPVRRAKRQAGPPALEVAELTEPGRVRNITLTLNRGEVLGLAGLLGAGRSELARILFGLDRAQSGAIRVHGIELGRASVARRIRHGLAYLTEDRHDEGLCLEASIAENIAMVILRQQARPPLGALHLDALARAVARIRAAVGLTPTARDDQPVKTLSGGHQQKVVLAKWLLAKPSVLILDEPTRGIDVGAKFEIYQLIRQLADDGAGVLLISSEIEELIGLCDRILVMRRGEIVEELAREGFDRERLLRAALQASEAA